MGVTGDLGIVNGNEYDEEEYTQGANDMTERGSELIDHLWVSGASITNVAEELTNALHNSVVSDALNLVVRIERR